MKLKDKTILITGASSGIGRAIAIELAKEEANILINYRSNEQGAKDTLKEVNKYSSGSIYKADLVDIKQVDNMFKEIRPDNNQIDVLVNNAGEAQPGDPEEYAVWENQWKNIFMTAVTVTNKYLELSYSGELRKIINITSLYGEFNSGNPDLIQYSAAKAAMNSWAMNMAKKLASNVLVNCVAPGWTMTPAWEGTSKDRIKALEESTHIKRFIEPHEIAEAAKFLAINDAMTGEIIHVDGGARLSKLS